MHAILGLTRGIYGRNQHLPCQPLASFTVNRFLECTTTAFCHVVSMDMSWTIEINIFNAHILPLSPQEQLGRVCVFQPWLENTSGQMLSNRSSFRIDSDVYLQFVDVPCTTHSSLFSVGVVLTT